MAQQSPHLLGAQEVHPEACLRYDRELRRQTLSANEKPRPQGLGSFANYRRATVPNEFPTSLTSIKRIGVISYENLRSHHKGYGL